MANATSQIRIKLVFGTKSQKKYSEKKIDADLGKITYPKRVLSGVLLIKVYISMFCKFCSARITSISARQAHIRKMPSLRIYSIILYGQEVGHIPSTIENLAIAMHAHAHWHALVEAEFGICRKKSTHRTRDNKVHSGVSAP